MGTLVKREEEETPPAKINLGSSSSSSSGPSEQREGNTFASQSTPRSSSPPPSYSEVHTRGKGTAEQGGKKEMMRLQKPRAIDIPIAGHPVTSPSSVTALTAPQRGGAPAMRPVPPPPPSSPLLKGPLPLLSFALAHFLLSCFIITPPPLPRSVLHSRTRRAPLRKRETFCPFWVLLLYLPDCICPFPPFVLPPDALPKKV